MGQVTVGTENETPIQLYYEDNGSGPPVVLLAGWPFDSRSWELQLHALLEAGYRVITYDRRGFGRSSQPTIGYEFDTLAADLDALLTHLDLREAVLVGISLGTGEVARYVGRFGTDRLAGCAFVESLAPSFTKSPDNPNGVDAAGVAATQATILADRAKWLTGMMQNFLNLDDYLGTRVSQDTVTSLWNTGAAASGYATWACVRTWLEDFTQDITRIDVPTLIIQGSADRILSASGQGERLHQALPQARYVLVEGAPHLLGVTHTKELDEALLSFVAEATGQPKTT